MAFSSSVTAILINQQKNIIQQLASLMNPWSIIFTLYAYYWLYGKDVRITVLNASTLQGFEDSIVSIIIITVYQLPIHVGNRSLIGLLNNSMSELGNPVPVCVDLICNRTRFTALLVSR